jgi:integration host factor alpha subunit
MAALTKAEMAEKLFEELGLNKREAKEVVELFFEEVRSSLEHNEQVKLSGFGNFDLRDKSQRPGRNPNHRPSSCDVSTRAKTEGESRGVCWTQTITLNSHRYPANDISPSVRSADSVP